MGVSLELEVGIIRNTRELVRPFDGGRPVNKLPSCQLFNNGMLFVLSLLIVKIQLPLPKIPIDR